MQQRTNTYLEQEANIWKGKG